MRINLQTINTYFSFKNQKLKEKQANFSQSSNVTNPFAPLAKDSVQISFGASDHCSVQDFEVKTIPNLRCPACGLIMLTDKQIASFVRDVSNKKGKELAATLEKYEDESVLTGKPSLDKTGHGIYRPIKKSVVDIYKKLAIENPTMDLMGLTRYQANISIEALIARQMEVIKELESYIRLNILDETERENSLKKLDEYVKQIKGESSEGFARKKFIYAMKNTSSEPSKRIGIEEIASKMPTSENDINSFFVKYANKKQPPSTNRIIAERLVNQTIPTAEHLIPKARGGKNRLSNYICDCADCNSRRGHTEFYDWLQTLPNFEERLQEYVNDVRIAIDSDLLSDRYDSYIENVIDTISTLSEGEVVLEIPDVTNPKKNAIVIAKREREIAEYTSKNKILEQRRKQLEQEIKKLEEYPHFAEVEEHQEIIAELARVDAEIDEINGRLISSRTPLYVLKQKVDDLDDKVKACKDPAEKVLVKAEYDGAVIVHQGLVDEINKLENRLGTLKRKKIKLKKQRKGFLQRENELRRQIDEKRAILTKINTAKDKVKSLGNVEQKREDLLQKIAVVEESIVDLETKNAQIVSQEGFDISNTSDFDEYQHQRELLTTAENLLSSKAYRKTAHNAGLTREVIEIAKKTIEEKIDDLLKLDSVQYFLNLASLKVENERKVNFDGRLAEINRTKKEVDALNLQIEALCQDKSADALQAEYEALVDERRTIDEIHKIIEKRKTLEHLTRTVRKNAAQLEKLENYREMTNSQYSSITSFINVDDIYC